MAYIRSRDNYDGNDNLETVCFRDVVSYMMDLAKEKPALLPIVQLLRASIIPTLQRSAPKRGDQEGHPIQRSANRMSRVLCAVTNKYKYTEQHIVDEVTHKTASTHTRACIQRVDTQAKSAKNICNSPDEIQEVKVGYVRRGSEGAQDGKVYGVGVEKNMRNNTNNLSHRLQVQEIFLALG